MGGYEVHLQGTWARKDTSPADITMLRNLSYAIRLAMLRNNEIPTVQFEVTAKQARRTRLAQPREGTFKATVRVPDVVNYPRQAKRTKVNRRAKDILRWFLEDVTCSSPKLTFDNSKTTQYRYG